MAEISSKELKKIANKKINAWTDVDKLIYKRYYGKKKNDREDSND